MAILVAIVVVPVLVAGVRIAANGWIPSSDNATIATRAYDVFSRDTPLVGQFTLAGGDDWAHSPGPLVYWLLAIPVRFGPAWSPPLFAAVFSSGLLALSVVLARRRAGIGFAAVVALSLVCLMADNRIVTFASVWNPWMGLAPFIALMMVAWSVADGDRKLLPLAVVLASIACQAHLTYVFASLMALAVACCFGWGPEIARIWRRRRDPVVGGPPMPVAFSPLAWSLVAGLVCWSLPFYEQLTAETGNLTLLLRSGQIDRPVGGIDAALGSSWYALGDPTAWFNRDSGMTIISRSFEHPGAVGIIGLAAIAVVLVAVTTMAIRRRDRLVASGGMISFSLVFGMVGVAAKFPTAEVVSAFYSFHWFAFAGIFTWLVIALGTVRHFHGARTQRLNVEPRPVAVVPVPMVTVLAVVVLLLFPPLELTDRNELRTADRLGDSLVAGTEPGGRYAVRGGKFEVLYTPLAVYRLHRAGRRPVVRPMWANSMGANFEQTGVRCDGIIMILDSAAAMPDGARLVDEIPNLASTKQADVIRVAMTADDGPEAAC